MKYMKSVLAILLIIIQKKLITFYAELPNAIYACIFNIMK